MNKSIQTITAGLLVFLSLTSCQKENLVSPGQPSSARRGASNDDLSPTIPQVYRLTKDGKTTLTYHSDGRLRKVSVGSGRGSLATHTDYTYAPGSIRAVTYQDALILRDETFFLDAKGRCVESTRITNLTYNNLPFESTQYWKFTYNAKGQLESCQDKNSACRTTNYIYNADGDVVKAILYDSPFTSKETTFAYDQPTGDLLLVDRYPLNMVGVNEHDPYLSIFGKPSKHLVKWMTSATSASATYYAYTLDPQGYVFKKDAYTTNGALTASTQYDYLVSDITVEL